MPNIVNCAWARDWSDYAPTFLRVATGLVFFMHGYQKLGMGVEGVAGFLTTLGFPMATAFAVILIAVEVVGGAALVLGLFTRTAAALSTIVAIVALLSVHLTKGFFVSNGGYEFILLILAASFSLLVTGAGAYSLDRQFNTAQK